MPGRSLLRSARALADAPGPASPPGSAAEPRAQRAALPAAPFCPCPQPPSAPTRRCISDNFGENAGQRAAGCRSSVRCAARRGGRAGGRRLTRSSRTERMRGKPRRGTSPQRRRRKSGFMAALLLKGLSQLTALFNFDKASSGAINFSLENSAGDARAAAPAAAAAEAAVPGKGCRARSGVGTPPGCGGETGRLNRGAVAPSPPTPQQGTHFPSPWLLLCCSMRGTEMGNWKAKVNLRRNILPVWGPADPRQASGARGGMQHPRGSLLLHSPPREGCTHVFKPHDPNAWGHPSPLTSIPMGKWPHHHPQLSPLGGRGPPELLREAQSCHLWLGLTAERGGTLYPQLCQEPSCCRTDLAQPGTPGAGLAVLQFGVRCSWCAGERLP